MNPRAGTSPSVKPMTRAAMRLVSACMVWATIVPAMAWATNATSQLCEQAAVTVSRESGVPLDVLRAITRVETGRSQDGQFGPWPWTINVAGKGYWLESNDEALDRAERAIARGTQSFDVGCFQINYAWHGAEFTGLQDMLNPESNARYAAKFLSELFKKTGDWRLAVGAYHSKTQEYATRYLAKYDAVVGDLPALQVAPRLAGAGAGLVQRQNGFPFLHSDETGVPVFGSLVPIARRGETPRSLIGG